MIDQAIFGDELYEAYQNQTDLADLVKNKYFDIQTDLMFGCATTETRMFYSQKADGILGLGPDTNIVNVQPNLIDMAFQNHKHTNEKLEFSICLGIKSGYMQIGGYDTKDHETNGNKIKIKYDTSLVAEQYGINLHGLKINNKELNSTISTFIDSGTTYTFLPSDYYDFIMNYIDSHCSDNQNCLGKRNKVNCFQFDQNNTDISIEQFFNSFPTLYLIFDDNQLFEWLPMDYFYEKNLYNFCISIDRGTATLGQSFMKYNDILFNREEKQIIITKANCGEYIFGNGEIYVPTIAEMIKETISDLDPTIVIIVLVLGVLLFLFTIVFAIKKYRIKKKLESDEKVMIQKNEGDQENNIKKNDIEQQGKGFQIGDNDGQNIEMAYKDIYQEKLEDDDNSKVKDQLADFQKFNFETN